MPSESALRDGSDADFELIETMRWEPALGFVRVERHLERLYRSAGELGFPYDPAAVSEALRKAVGPDAVLRTRLTLARDGAARAASTPFAPLPLGARWTVRLAETRLGSGDPLLRHKTTRRGPYEAARGEFPADRADEVLLLNERGEVCEGVITNVFVAIGGDGVLLTPALSCGLLPGVLRSELIALGKAREATLGPHDLRAAEELFVGNSLRGLIRARLA